MKPVISTVIIDDEPASVKTLADALSHYEDFKIEGTAGDTKTGQELLLKKRPALIFLDVEMPNETGVEMISALRDEIDWDMQLVFYSAYNKYMIDAIRNAAFDFLIKPFRPEELEVIVQRIRQSLQKKKPREESLSSSVDRLLPNGDIILLQTITGIRFIPYKDIVLFSYQGKSRCWQVILNDQHHESLTRKTSSHNILTLSPSFVQVNQETILNISYLAIIENYNRQCILYPPFNELYPGIQVSRRYFDDIRNRFEQL